jgi:hypothetical protein
MLLLAAVVATACDEPQPPPMLIHSVPGERMRCPEPEPWAAAFVTDAPGCGIGFGDDRVAEARAAALDGGTDAASLEIVEGSDDLSEVARSVAFFTSRSGVSWQWASVPSDACDPGEIGVPDDCEDCELECEAVLDGCEDCCEPDPSTECGADTPCCPGQACIDAAEFFSYGSPRGRRCADVCTVDADCPLSQCCAEIDGTEERACLPC